MVVSLQGAPPRPCLTNKREAAAEPLDSPTPEPAAVRFNAGLDGPRTECGLTTPPAMEIGAAHPPVSLPVVAQVLGTLGGRHHQRPGSRTNGRDRGSRTVSFAPPQATPVPAGLSGRCAPSCDLLPPRLCGRWYASTGEEGRPHQPLPTDRTGRWRRLTPCLAITLPGV